MEAIVLKNNDQIDIDNIRAQCAGQDCKMLSKECKRCIEQKTGCHDCAVFILKNENEGDDTIVINLEAVNEEDASILLKLPKILCSFCIQKI